MNQSEQKFLDAWHKHGVLDSDPESQWSCDEFRSPANRKYIYDFAWPKIRVLIEIQGHGRGHIYPKNRARDARKARVAMAAGWTLIPVTTDCMASEDKRAEVCEQIQSICDNTGEWGAPVACDCDEDPTVPWDVLQLPGDDDPVSPDST